uniref:Uncharacterized protein n=1 Tax=Panagrolaimus superbus TaxID=310955 RepID=A0A914YPQ8_9BILA
MHALKVDPFLAFKQEYRIVFEPHINEFEQNLANQGLLDFEIGGKKVFKDLNGSDYFRLIQQFGKDNISKDNGDSMKAAMIMAEKVGFNTPEGIAACHQQVLNEMFSHIGTNPQGPQRDIRQQFLNRFNDPNDSLSTELATNFSNGLNETEKYLIENHPGGSGTGLKHRYDLDNEDPRTVAAVAYVHATEGGKRLTRREWDQETKIEKTKIYISNGTEKTGQLRLSQDGTKWVLMAPEDEN